MARAADRPSRPWQWSHNGQAAAERRGRRATSDEIVDAIRRMVAQGIIDPAVADCAIADLRALEIERFDLGLLLWRAWELRDNLPFYDALYVALAEALGAPLVTLDARLAGAPGVTATVEVIRGARRR